MSQVKYRVREFTPTGNMSGRTHSFYAEVVINNDLSNADLAARIAARTGFKAYECQAIIAAIAEVVSEEVLESNRISLANEQGTKMLSIYPKVSGSVSDLDIQRETTAAHAADPSVEVRNVATEEDLTPNRLSWNLGSTVGVKYSKQFSTNKSAKKVKYVASDVVVPSEEGGDDNGSTGGNGGNGGNNGGVNGE